MIIKKGNYKTIKDFVLGNAGIGEDEYFHPDPMPYIHKLHEAVDFFKKYIEENPDSPIWIIGDYDADGICATSILYHGLFRYTKRQPITRIPHPIKEGYGLSESIIDEIDSGILITVDNGIAAAAAIKKAKEKGLAVIVTDHHLPPVDNEGNCILPDADVVIDPHADHLSPFKDYCGAGLAFRFIQELMPDRNFRKLLPFAAIATVADVVPIKGANWMLVKEGLQIMNRRRAMPGVNILLDKCNLGRNIKADDIAFNYAPVLNAGRRVLDRAAEPALEVFKAMPGKEPGNLPWKADGLIEANETRKKLVKKVMAKLSAVEFDRPIVLYLKGVGEGIIGLIAGKLCEQYQCPVVIFTNDINEDYLKGSGRSVDGAHLKNILDQVDKECFVKYGGHAGAAGLTIHKSKLALFKKSFARACGSVPPIDTNLYYDLELTDHEYDKVLEELNRYAPYGKDNPAPKFHYTAHHCTYETYGSDGLHAKITSGKLKLVGFDMYKAFESAGFPQTIECVGTLEEDHYMGMTSIRFRISGFEPLL